VLGRRSVQSQILPRVTDRRSVPMVFIFTPVISQHM
jgi:hypothetical protein